MELSFIGDTQTSLSDGGQVSQPKLGLIIHG